MPSPPVAIGSSLVRAASCIFLAALAGCTGGLGERSVAELSGTVPVGSQFRRIRVEIQNGTIGVVTHAERHVAFAGGVRRAADTRAQLEVLEKVAVDLVGEADAADPTILVVRGPRLDPAAQPGMLGYELGLHVPADLPLEIVVAANGHVTVAGLTTPLVVRTERGDLRFEKCRGGVKAWSGRGNVIGYGLAGRVDVEVAGVGDMQMFVEAPDDLLRLQTGQGTIQAYVPPDTGFVCSLRSETGRVGSDFGLPSETPTRFSSAMKGQHGDGRTKIVLATGSGYLSLQKLRD